MPESFAMLQKDLAQAEQLIHLRQSAKNFQEE
jgi:hypothetical protein